VSPQTSVVQNTTDVPWRRFWTCKNRAAMQKRALGRALVEGKL
jgi:hypothetical protein